MSGGIYLIQSDKRLVEMKQEPYQLEKDLQGLLADYPNLLAGDQIDDRTPRRWLLVAREASVPDEQDGSGRWSLDHLFIDQDGVPTLVEVKRSSDTRVRREVVGQMLDYVANGTAYWSVDDLRAQFTRTCKARNQNDEEVLANFLEPEADVEGFWRKVKTNFNERNVRLLFVADEIPLELRRVVEFLNEEMTHTEVLAVETRQYVGGGLQTLVPLVYGRTMKATDTKQGSSPPRKWDKESFFSELRRRFGAAAATELKTAEKILQWAESHAATDVDWGAGSRSGSFVPFFSKGGRKYYLFAVFTYGKVELYFQWYRSYPPFDSEEKRRELLSKLNAFLPKEIPGDAIDRRPGIPLSDLEHESVLEKFLRTFEWFLEEIR